MAMFASHRRITDGVDGDTHLDPLDVFARFRELDREREHRNVGFGAKDDARVDALVKTAE